ncbi:hypothetical protein [Lichenihabitans psoromatis]|uniref:hypothetical protein n=1 Tax=Lichenihabitans psoromatis TaxID=2528642 RepID=UPI0010383184|nr:hypothetical protein [Lichenihabitans psoromatis]
MNLRAAFLSTVMSVALLGSAQAAPATTDEAQRLTTLFQRYLGKPTDGQPSAVVVTPDGETYKVDVDLSRIFAPFAALGLAEVKAGHYLSILTPAADGTWHVVSGGLQSFTVTINDQTTIVNYGDSHFDGIFDPKIASFVSSTSSSNGSAVSSNTPKVSSSSKSTGTTDSKFTGTDGGNGTVNAKVDQTLRDFTYALSVQTHADVGAPKSEKAFEVNAQIASGTGHIEANNLRNAQLLDLWAFLVAHPSKQQLVANQTELKGLLSAMLPFVTVLSGDVSIQKIILNTPLGQFGANTFGERLDVGNENSKDVLGIGLNADGFTIPADLAPAWATGLVPSGLDLHVKVGPVHFTEALQKAIVSADFGAEKPLTEAQTNDIVQTFALPQNIVVTLAPSTITTPVMTVKAEAQMQFTEQMPTGTATVSATGLDKALDMLTTGAQTNPDAAQAFAVLTLMKQLGRAEGPDRYSWLVEAKPGSDILINGKPMQAAAPQAEPQPVPKPSQKPKKKPAPKTAP